MENTTTKLGTSRTGHRQPEIHLSAKDARRRANVHTLSAAVVEAVRILAPRGDTWIVKIDQHKVCLEMADSSDRRVHATDAQINRGLAILNRLVQS